LEVSAVILILSVKKPREKLFMIIRKSFFIRWLLYTEDEQQQERSVIDIEHIQSGSNRRVSSLEEAGQWMKDAKESEKEDRITEIE